MTKANYAGSLRSSSSVSSLSANPSVSSADNRPQRITIYSSPAGVGSQKRRATSSVPSSLLGNCIRTQAIGLRFCTATSERWHCQRTCANRAYTRHVTVRDRDGNRTRTCARRLTSGRSRGGYKRHININFEWMSSGHSIPSHRASFQSTYINNFTPFHKQIKNKPVNM